MSGSAASGRGSSGSCPRSSTPGRLRERAREIAELVGRNSPAAMAATKRALWGALEAGLTEACKAGALELAAMWGHPDQTEGPAAWAEKREPQWAPIEHLIVERHGPVGWLINNRPDQLNAMNAAMRDGVRRRVAGARRRPRGARDRAHR